MSKQNEISQFDTTPTDEQFILARKWIEQDPATETLSAHEKNIAATAAAHGIAAGNTNSSDRIILQRLRAEFDYITKKYHRWDEEKVVADDDLEQYIGFTEANIMNRLQEANLPSGSCGDKGVAGLSPWKELLEKVKPEPCKSCKKYSDTLTKIAEELDRNDEAIEKIEENTHNRLKVLFGDAFKNRKIT